jgi:hypothetical protein
MRRGGVRLWPLTLRGLIVVLAILSLSIAALGKGPTNAGGKAGYVNNGKWTVQIYIGPDWYGAGSTSTTTTDGTVIGVISSEVMMEKVRYFDEDWYTDKDWAHFKFWLSAPVTITFAGGRVETATRFVFIKMNYTATGGYSFELQAYK